MTPTELSKFTGKTKAYCSYFLRGKRGCSLDTARKLTRLFGKNPLWWLESTGADRKERFRVLSLKRTPPGGVRAKS